VRLRITSSLAAIASPGVAANFAPDSTSSAARLAVRFHTVTGWLPFIRTRAIA
jgi:hypothetical protein